MSTTFKTRLVKSDFVRDRWEEISELLAAAFRDSAFSEGFYAERPAEHTWEEINKPGGSELGHLIAEGEDGRLLGAVFCVPVNRPEHVRTCDLGWFFVDPAVPSLNRARITDALANGVHEELARCGYEMVVTEMGTEAGAQFFSQRHGYAPAPTEEKPNRWIRSLREASDCDINAKSAKREWDQAGSQQARYATVDIAENELIIDLKPLMKRAKHPSAYTLQLAEGFHYQVKAGSLGFNHHCSPNCFICFEDLTIRALRDIEAGEELTFHYCTTEYELANPFDCVCGSPECLGWVGGFKFLKDHEIAKIATRLSPYLKSKLVQAVA